MYAYLSTVDIHLRVSTLGRRGYGQASFLHGGWSTILAASTVLRQNIMSPDCYTITDSSVNVSGRNRFGRVDSSKMHVTEFLKDMRMPDQNLEEHPDE